MAALAVVWTAGSAAGNSGVVHRLVVELDPAGGTLHAVDHLEFPAGGGRVREFSLHRGLYPAAGGGARVELVAAGDGRLARYRLETPQGATSVTLNYGGPIQHPLSDERDYARGFRSTPGTIGDEGVYLSGESGWYPDFSGTSVTFELTVKLPPGWDAVSQGRREDRAGAVVWSCPDPQDEIYLVAGRFTRTARTVGPVRAETYLRADDPALADRYLAATGKYLALFSGLIGAYPYPKFALVENFWETGWGMPSFTLLGSRVLRFPFILNSSYPHEILHNWWGNSVYVDTSRGNWTEGLTAYLADHLIREDQGRGALYRLTTLQKYADYAARGRDFPLAQFRSRHSSSTEAVGYGKALMVFHMLRRHLGDEGFTEGLRRFYARYRFQAATWDDLLAALGRGTGEDLVGAYAPWLDRPGAPLLRIDRAEGVPGQAGGWSVDLALSQTQPGDPYPLEVPVAITLEGRDRAFETVVRLGGVTGRWRLAVGGRPLRVDVDPAFDLFRRLDPEETPPALSGGFGAPTVTVVLPSGAPAALGAAYRKLAEAWAGSQPGRWTVVDDDGLEDLPEGGAVWVLGWSNRLRSRVEAALARRGVTIGSAGVSWAGTDLPRAGHSIVLTVRHPDHPERTVAWLATDAPAPVPGLARKLPHYHKYSYLGFEGDEPVNVEKGRWPVLASPLTRYLAAVPTAPGALAERRALARVPTVFSSERMLGTVRTLSDPSLRGRGLGTPELDRVGRWVAKRFAGVGLEPGGADGSWFQRWSEMLDGHPVEMANVVGVLPGTRADWADQSVVVGAHYDHLGGGLHPGADDNASGVAVLLETARALVGRGAPERSVVFVAFTGEERGRRGSLRYLEAPGRYAPGAVRAMINLDTVGRLGGKKLLVLGAGSAAEWIHIANGAGSVTGVPVKAVARDPGGSDQESFRARGIPAVQFFTGPHADYHRPGDTADKVDGPGLVKVARVVREFVTYLAGRAEPLTGRGNGPEGGGRPGPRRVRLGTIPDYGFEGPGVRLEGVEPGSPAERAGLRAGDVVVELGGRAVEDLRQMAGVLRGLEPENRVEVKVHRGDTTLVFHVVAGAR